MLLDMEQELPGTLTAGGSRIIVAEWRGEINIGVPLNDVTSLRIVEAAVSAPIQPIF